MSSRILSLSRALAILALVAAAAAPARASIERLDLAAIVAKSDAAIEGTITRSRVLRVDDPKDGPELYFTFLTIEGRSLADGAARTVEVFFAGGFIDARHGVFNSEAPAADDVHVGNRIVAFYKHTENAGGGVAGNALYAAHGGLFRAFEAAQGTIVQGRGDGYALRSNVRLADLRSQVTELARAKEERRDGTAPTPGAAPRTAPQVTPQPATRKAQR
ncbi:MAG: hypothetical protein IPJ77_04280 [Planctomycetes bacterium]|nr:hypothetical protein [Planctomycetota bacterium]